MLGGSEETTLGVSRGPEGGGVGGRPAVCSVCIDRAAGGWSPGSALAARSTNSNAEPVDEETEQRDKIENL